MSNGELDVIGILSGVKPPVAEPVVIEPTTKSTEGIDDWLTTVGTIFDRGMDIYESARGRMEANKIIRNEQVTKPVVASEPIPATTYAKATAVAVAQEFKKPLVIGAVIFVGLGILAIYKPKILW